MARRYRDAASHRAQVRAELAAVVDRMFDRDRQKIDPGPLNDSEQVDYVAELLPRHGAHAIQRGRNLRFVTGRGVGRVHDAAGIGIVGWRREHALRDAVQKPLILQREMPDEPQASLRFRVRLVVETIVGNGADHPQRGLHFAFKFGYEKIRDGFGLIGIHWSAPIRSFVFCANYILSQLRPAVAETITDGCRGGAASTGRLS